MNEVTSAPAETVRLTVLLGRLLGIIPRVTIISAASLYFAGYTYWTKLLQSFGLAFGATEMSTPEIMGIGYTVVLFSIIEHFWSWVVYGLLQLMVVVLISVGLVFVVVWRWRDHPRFNQRFETFKTRTTNLFSYAMASTAVMLLLAGSFSAGDYAATVEAKDFRSRAARGCCFTYLRKGSPPITGVVLAQVPERIYLLTKTGLISMPLAEMTIVPTSKLQH